MLTGEFGKSLDEKGRLALPTRIRAEISGTTLVLTRGIERCLWLFEPDVWAEFSASILRAASPLSSKARMLQRRIVAPAQEIDIDKAGRINIPQRMGDAVGLEKDCIVLGIQKYLEIWDAEEYQAYLESIEEDFKDATEELGGLVSL